MPFAFCSNPQLKAAYQELNPECSPDYSAAAPTPLAVANMVMGFVGAAGGECVV